MILLFAYSKEMKIDKKTFHNKKTLKMQTEIIDKSIRTIDRELAQLTNKINRITIKI